MNTHHISDERLAEFSTRARSLWDSSSGMYMDGRATQWDCEVLGFLFDLFDTFRAPKTTEDRIFKLRALRRTFRLTLSEARKLLTDAARDDLDACRNLRQAEAQEHAREKETTE